MSAAAPPPKRERLREMFGRIAGGYDHFNSLLSFGMHHGWRRFAVRQCDMPPDGLALDVAAGTGDFLIETLRRGGRGVGVDPCEPMLALGREKLAAAGLGARTTMVVGEAEHLPVATGRFDCATIGFGLRNVTDIDCTFAEMARAVRPGGRVVALEIAKPRNPLFRAFFLFYFYRLSPLVAQLFGGDAQAYRYLPDSLKSFRSRDELAASMGRASLVDVTVHDLAGGSVAVHVGTKAG